MGSIVSVRHCAWKIKQSIHLFFVKQRVQQKINKIHTPYSMAVFSGRWTLFSSFIRRLQHLLAVNRTI